MTAALLPRIPRVLVLLGCFKKGVEASGPNQTLLGMVHATRGEFDFHVVAEAVDGDALGRWQTVSGVPQIPIAPGLAGAVALRRVIARTPHDLLISNGFFDRTMTMPMLAMRRLGLIARKPTLLAPHGELSPGAIDLRSGRKRAYIRAVRSLGLLHGVDIIATTQDEERAIQEQGRLGARIRVCPNIYPVPPAPRRSRPSGGPILRLVYASRVDEKKNLRLAIRTLARVERPVRFDIYGPISDAGYWALCQKEIAALPSYVEARHRGVLAQKEIHEALAEYDLMFMPTLGENFGYSIADALLAGTPVLISDRTPWRGLAEAGAGWDLPLDDEEGFVSALKFFQTMPHEAREQQRRTARAYAIEQLNFVQASQALKSALYGALGLRPDTSSS
jgi:glycosyltransferase involved in cell wall biosynthesis